MTDEAMNPLRGRMIGDMTIRKLAPRSLRGERDRVETEPMASKLRRHDPGMIRVNIILVVHFWHGGCSTKICDETAISTQLRARGKLIDVFRTAAERTSTS
jgi:hypothetical protein